MSDQPAAPVVKEDPPFLEVDPPNWAARGLAYLLLLLFLVVVLASVFIQVPESVSGAFVLVPIKGTDPIRSSDDGFVSAVRIVDGQAVKRGEILFVIQSSDVGTRSADFQVSQTGMKSATERMVSIRKQYESRRQEDEEETRKLQEQVTYLSRMLDLKKEQLRLINEIVSSYERLQKEGIASRVDYNNQKLEANKTALELEELETELLQARSSLKKVELQMQQHSAAFREATDALLGEKETSRIRMQALDKELLFTEGNELSVPAPCDGIVLRVHMKSPGSVIQVGEMLCELACSGERLQAEVTVPQNGLSRIHRGQGVKLLYDAFPYQRYGVRFGTVHWVSPSSVAAKEDAIFPVRIDLADKSIRIKGEERLLLPGMRGKAQIVVDRRSLISYAFSPIRQLREMLAEPPAQTPAK